MALAVLGYRNLMQLIAPVLVRCNRLSLWTGSGEGPMIHDLA
jgi:hypothetical protein